MRRCARWNPAARVSMRGSTSASNASRSAARTCCRRWPARHGAICCRKSMRERREEITAESLRALAELVRQSARRRRASATRPAANTWSRCSPNSAKGPAGRDALGALQALAQGQAREPQGRRRRGLARETRRGSSRPARASRNSSPTWVMRWSACWWCSSSGRNCALPDCFGGRTARRRRVRIRRPSGAGD